MKGGAGRSEATRERLLEAGAEVFAERGYRRATVREILRRAGAANLSAVNYHFRDKAQLYAAVLERLMRRAGERFPTRMGLGSRAPGPRARLRAFVRSLIHRVLDPGLQSRLGRLMTMEMVDPTPALDRVVEAVIRPLYEELLGILRELLPRGAGRRSLHLAARSVVGQVLFYRHCAPVLARLDRRPAGWTPDLEALAAHVASFSLGGVAAAGRGPR
jgi:AcrR family transcriptional regulator